MIDEHLARSRAHRQNIHRYRRLLQTDITPIERCYIERRIVEEESALNVAGTNVRGIRADQSLTALQSK